MRWLDGITDSMDMGLGAEVGAAVPILQISKFNLSVVSDSVRPRGLQPTRLLCLWDSSGKNIGVGCHDLLQGIFPIQSRAAPGKSGLHARGEGERVLALESRA